MTRKLLDRANIAAAQNWHETAANNLSAKSTNLQASHSRVENADFTRKFNNLDNGQMPYKVAQAMLARAKQWDQQLRQLMQ